MTAFSAHTSVQTAAWTAARHPSRLGRTTSSTASGGWKRWTPIVCSHADRRMVDGHGEALPHRNQRERQPD